jgi:predicted dehydrogenase
MRVALVGCGKIADGHAEQIAKLPHLARLTAVCDSEPLMAEQLAARFSIPHYYADFRRMLERERPDVVHVTTPPASHRALAELALDAGCHVYVEKPLTESLADDVALITKARASGKKLAVGYTYLYDPPALALRRMLSEGVLGEVVHVDSVYGYDLGGSYGQAMLRDPEHWVRRLRGGLAHNNIDHLLNKVAELVEDDGPSIVALGNSLAQPEMIDELSVSIRGARVTAHALFSCHARPVMHRLTVYGTRDTVGLDFLARTVTLAGGRRLPSALGRLWPAFEQGARLWREGLRNAAAFARSEMHYFAGLEELIRRFYESICNGTEPPIPYRHILWVSRAVDEVMRQLAEAPAGKREVA